MSWENEEKSHNDEPKKPELLPPVDKAEEIVEVLVAIYLVMHNPEDIANDDTGVESANHSRDAGPEKEGGEQTR